MDRRTSSRTPLSHARRRYPRLFLDVDWFIECDSVSTFGRGLDINPRGAVLPLSIQGAPRDPVLTLRIALPARARFFTARARVARRAGNGVLLRFIDVNAEDLELLGKTLIDLHGPLAIPSLERRFERFTHLEPRHLRTAAPGDWSADSDFQVTVSGD